MMSSGSSNALALKSVPSLQIRFDNGERVGQVIQLNKAIVTIGRGPENQLPFVNDSKMSRTHAEIRFENGQYWIHNVSPKNYILINGKEQNSHALTTPVRLQVGDTLLSLGALSPAVRSTSAMAQRAGVPATQTSNMAVAPNSYSTTSYATPNYQAPPAAPMNSSRKNFYIIVGVVVVGLIWLFTSENAQKKKVKSLRTSDQSMYDIQVSEEKMKKVEKIKEEQGMQTLQYKLAQENYLKGFRDYSQGQYSRAMSSFQAALSFYPQHELARKYYSLSKRKFDEVVQANMVLGQQNKGKNNFRLCRSSYANVMIMLRDPNDPIYREAKQYYMECTALNEGRN